jgi:hypothetical protein
LKFGDGKNSKACQTQGTTGPASPRTIILFSGEGSLLSVGFYEALVEPSSVKVAKNVSRACSPGQEYYSTPPFHGAVAYSLFLDEMRCCILG